MQREFDVLIVGAGILGLTTAMLCHLRFPDLRIAIVDQSSIGSGCSRFGGASDVPFCPQKGHEELILRTKEIRKNYPRDFAFSRQVRSVWVGQIESLQSRILDTSFSPLTKNEINQLSLQLGVEEQAYVSNSGGIGSPFQACMKLASTMMPLSNVSIFEGTRIDSIETSIDQLIFKTASGERFQACHGVVCTGPWLTKQSFVHDRRHKIVKKIIALHIDQAFGLETQIHHDSPDIYLLPDPVFKNRMIFCFRSDDWHCATNPDCLSISVEEMCQARNLLMKHFRMPSHRIRGGRVFCDGYSTDGVPVVEAHPDNANLIIAGLCSGAGYRHAPGLADKILQLLDHS